MTTINLAVIDGLGNPKNVAAEQATSGTLTPHQVPEVLGLPVSPTNALPTKPGQITAAAVTAHNIPTGGTAIVAILGGAIITGARIANPRTALSMFVDMVNPADKTAPGLNGTTEEIGPGGCWEAPGPLTGNVSVNCALGDDNHSFTAVIF